MEFDIVIVTRNRQSALRVSLPLMLAQTRLPAQLIIVDSSDNHNETRDVVETAVQQATGKTDLQVYATPAGTSLQRNIGVRNAASPVVLFPDDDALWFPGFTDGVMKIYERDSEGLIGGVRAEESFTSPIELNVDNGRPYDMALRDKLQLRVGRVQYRMERRYFPDPLFVEAASRYQDLTSPGWLKEENAALSGPMFGFSMSFRTEFIRQTGFDETLGRYALFEDLDASLSILNRKALICARDARVFHFRAPENRVNGREWGVMHILNRAYVLCKHSPPGSEARRLHTRFMYYKLGRYLIQANSAYGRERLQGAWRAALRTPELFSCPREELGERYIRLRQACMN